MIEAFQRYVRRHRLLHAGQRVGLAVSGGADSVALLRAVAALAPQLGVVPLVLHFNHCLRGAESEADATFVAALAEKLGVPLVVESGAVSELARREHLSLEAAGRRARYAFFLRAARAERLDAVATAHTRDDQAETVLLRLLRGTGTRGLAGIHRACALADLVDENEEKSDCAASNQGSERVVSDHGRAKNALPQLIRPLLGITRRQIESYLASLNQPFCQDSSNRSAEFLRNRIRLELLPQLEHEFNPQLRAALAETAEVAAAEDELLEALAEERLCADSAQQEPCRMAAKRLANVPLALARRMLRSLCRQAGLALDFAQLEGLRKFVLAGRAGRLGLPRGFCAELRRVDSEFWLRLVRSTENAPKRCRSDA